MKLSTESCRPLSSLPYAKVCDAYSYERTILSRIESYPPRCDLIQTLSGHNPRLEITVLLRGEHTALGLGGTNGQVVVVRKKTAAQAALGKELKERNPIIISELEELRRKINDLEKQKGALQDGLDDNKAALKLIPMRDVDNVEM